MLKYIIGLQHGRENFDQQQWKMTEGYPINTVVSKRKVAPEHHSKKYKKA